MPGTVAVPNPRASVFGAAGALFFASGLAALLYEVVWLRLLGLSFGNTVHAVTTVLAAYMGGLALGSVLAGRRADRVRRPLRAFALLEVGIGIYCLATPLLFRGLDAVHLSVVRALQPGPAVGGTLRFLLAAAILLPPTALMGATLPLLGRAVAERRALAASRIGTLYALNTCGAVAGTVLSGFVLLPVLGLRSTVALGALLDVLVAAVALLVERTVRSFPAASGAPPGEDGGAGEDAAPLPPGSVATVLLGVGAAGAASMAYEVAWTRALALTVGSSTYAFTAMLATFLVGLAAGAFAAARVLARRAGRLPALGWIQISVSLLVVVLLPAFGRLPELLLAVLRHTGVSHGAALGAQFGLSFALMIGPTLLVGATFPLAVGAVASSLGRIGRDVGVVYGANTLGTIVGSLLAGFLLVPTLGIQATVVAAAAVNLAVGLAVLAVAPQGAPARWRLAAAALVAFIAVVAARPRWDALEVTAGVPVYAADLVKDRVGGFRDRLRLRELLFYEEGLSTTVAVIRSPTAVMLSVNGKIDASNTRDMGTQLLLGHLGAVVHPAARRALVVGLASGITAGALAQHPLEAIDVAEIEPAMREAQRFFARENRNVLADPRVRVLYGDGRHILAVAPRPYDLIVSEPSNPWISGVANLFTREFYELARSRLAPGGVMVQWLQTYSIFGRDMQMVVRTFSEVFPQVSVWAGTLGDVLLVGTSVPVTLDLDAIRARLAASPGAREDFERYGWRDEGLVFRFLLSDEDARRYAQGAPLNTDDLPLLEFSAPRALYASSAQENEALMRSFRRADRPRVVGLDPARWDGPSGRLRAAAAHWAEGFLEDAALELDRLGPAEGLSPADRVERARLLFLLGRYGPALEDLERLGDGAPAAARPYRRALAVMAEPELADRVGATLVPLAGGWFARSAALGELLLNLSMARDDPELRPLALELLSNAVTLEPTRVPPLVNHAIALALSGRADEAVAALRRAVAIDPGDARTRFNLGRVLERAGRIGEASDAYADAVRLAPAWPPPRERLEALRGRPR